MGLTECDRCKPGAFVPLSPVMERGALRFSLSWGEKPMDLDLYAYRRNWRDWDQNCETYYMKKTGGIVSHNLDLHPESHEAENWWLAGCLRFTGDSYEFITLDVFFNDKPSQEVSDLCLEHFGYNAPTTARPWYQFWG